MLKRPSRSCRQPPATAPPPTGAVARRYYSQQPSQRNLAPSCGARESALPGLIWTVVLPLVLPLVLPVLVVVLHARLLRPQGCTLCLHPVLPQHSTAQHIGRSWFREKRGCRRPQQAGRLSVHPVSLLPCRQPSQEVKSTFIASHRQSFVGWHVPRAVGATGPALQHRAGPTHAYER